MKLSLICRFLDSPLATKSFKAVLMIAHSKNGSYCIDVRMKMFHLLAGNESQLERTKGNVPYFASVHHVFS